MILIDSNGNYPRYIGDLQLEFPSWKQGDTLPEGWHEVVASELPEIGENETFIEHSPVLVDGIYHQSFSVRPLTEEELAKKNAPETARQKLVALGFSEDEIRMIKLGLI